MELHRAFTHLTGRIPCQRAYVEPHRKSIHFLTTGLEEHVSNSRLRAAATHSAAGCQGTPQIGTVLTTSRRRVAYIRSTDRPALRRALRHHANRYTF